MNQAQAYAVIQEAYESPNRQHNGVIRLKYTANVGPDGTDKTSPIMNFISGI